MMTIKYVSMIAERKEEIRR